MVSTISEILALKRPVEAELLIAVFDLTNFTSFSRSASSSEVFQKMKIFNEMTSRFVHENGGLLVKFLGDAGLCLFPITNADHAISAMVKLKSKIDSWLKQNIPNSHLAINCHVGPVTVGPTPGYQGLSQIDVIGDTVNICFTMSKKGFVISPQAFRSLKAESRKQFRKFTPPIVYHLSKEDSRD